MALDLAVGPRFELLELRRLLSTYYVSPAGRDAAAGGADAPWQTLQRAADAVSAGDTVLVRAGAYAGFYLKSPHGGAAGAPVTFRAEVGAVINAPSKTGNGVDLNGVSYVNVQGFRIDGIPGAGARVTGGHHLALVGNRIDQSQGAGVLASDTDDLLVQDNIVSRSVTQSGVSVTGLSQRSVVRGNRLSGNYLNGLSVASNPRLGATGAIAGDVIEGNTVMDNGAGGGSGITLAGVQASLVRNNVVAGSRVDGISLASAGAGLGSTADAVVNNTVVQPVNSRWAIYVGPGSPQDAVVNNILYNAGPWKGSASVAADSLPGFVSDYNVLVNSLTYDNGNSIVALPRWRAVTGQDAHSIVSTPAALFVDPSGPDYHLAAGSPAVNAGVAALGPAVAPATDLDGFGRPAGPAVDVGAYERDVVPPVATVEAIDPSPRAAPVDALTITFSKPVSGFDLADLRLARDGGPDLLTPSQSLATTDGQTYVLGNLSPLTRAAGSYQIKLAAGGSGIQDRLGNRLAADAVSSFAINPYPPTAVIGPVPAAVDEGSVVAFDGTASYDPDGNPVAYAWAFGDGGGATGPAPAHAFADDGTYAVTLTVGDRYLSSTAATSVAVRNVPPQLGPPSDATAVIGRRARLDLGSFADAGVGDGPWAVDVNWGDGTAHTTFTAAGTGPLGARAHAYGSPGTYDVTLTVTDKDGGAGTAAFAATAVAPLAVSARPVAADEGRPFTATVASFTYADRNTPAGDFTAAVAWGDGTTSAGAVRPDGAGGFVVVASGTYADSGTYPLTVTVRDADGFSASAPATATVANVAPVAGVTGAPTTAVGEGAPITVTAIVADPSPADAAAGFTYRWRVTRGEAAVALPTGTPDDGKDFTFIPTDDGDYAIGLTVADKDGGAAVAAAAVVVTGVAPTATLSNSGPAPEGGTAAVRFSNASDPSADDAAAGLTYSYDLDNDGTFDVVTAAATQSLFLPDDGTYTVRGRVADKDGGFTDYTTTIVAAAVPPAARFDNGGPVDAGSAAAVAFSNQADPSPADVAAGFVYSYDFDNDGRFDVTATRSAAATVPTAYLGTAGAHVVRGRIADKDGAFADYTTAITVRPRPAPAPSPTGREFDVGPGRAYPSVTDVPWNALAAGDTVWVHWRSDADGGAYHGKINLTGRGTAGAHIRVVGVPGPQGQRPVLDAAGAATNPADGTSWSGIQPNGLIVITRPNTAHDYFTYKPGYIDIEGLDLRNANQKYAFTDSSGATQQYGKGAAAVYVERGEYITVRDCELSGSGNGFFVLSSNSTYSAGGNHAPGDGSMSRHILFERNDVHDNGNPGSYREHNIYTEGVDVVFQYNRLGRLTPGALGNNLKDRSAGTVVRYNRIETGGHLLDLVDPQASAPVAVGEPTFRDTYVYGNELIQDGTGGFNKVVHYGGDDGLTQNYRKGTLHFYNNTVVFTAPQSRVYYSTLLSLETNDERADVRNNVIARLQPDPSHPVPLTELRLMAAHGVADFGTNWVDKSYVVGGWGYDGPVTGLSNLKLGTDPGLYGPAAGPAALHPAAGSPVIDAGGAAGPAAVAYAVGAEYVDPQGSRARPVVGTAPDLGAFEFGLG